MAGPRTVAGRAPQGALRCVSAIYLAPRCTNVTCGLSDQRAPDAPARLEAPLVRFVFASGALPDEIYKDRGASFVGQANTLKEIYVSSCKCMRQAHARHATTLPAGRHVDLRFCRGFDGKLGRRSQNHLSPPSPRLRTAAAHRLDRRLPLNAARARQPVDRGTRRRHTLAAGMGVKAAMPLLHRRGHTVVGRLNVARYGKRVERVHGPRCRRAGTNLHNRAGR